MRPAKYAPETARATMPVWDGRDDTVLAHLNTLEAFLTNGQIAVWRENGISEEEIAREVPALVARHRAIFDRWRQETRLRLERV